jgi:cytochrome bd-type quinol oxidase subunit 2
MTAEAGRPTDALVRFADESAIRLGQANQRLLQEQTIFEQQLEQQKQIALLQKWTGWVILVMLPAVAVVCVVIFFAYQSLPSVVVAAASAAFFVDIVGTAIAGYKALMPAQVKTVLSATTRDPFERKNLDAAQGATSAPSGSATAETS